MGEDFGGRGHLQNSRIGILFLPNFPSDDVRNQRIEDLALSAPAIARPSIWDHSLSILTLLIT